MMGEQNGMMGEQNAVMGEQHELQEMTPRPEESEIIRRCERETKNVIMFKLTSFPLTACLLPL